MNEPKKFYIADWHYGHENCIYFDNRPYISLAEMNEDLIRRWNEAVRPGDMVYILGDMFWCTAKPAIEVLKKLNGQKILIKGNHDRCRDKTFSDCFVKITDYLEVDDDGDKIVLCHYPIPCYKNHFYGWLHFYGHVHTSFEWNMIEHTKKMMTELYDKKCEMFNVGAMMSYMNYTPRTKREILKANGYTFIDIDVEELEKETTTADFLSDFEASGAKVY